jgi:formylglycine-generating enzyme required for sulfatase activity
MTGNVWEWTCEPYGGSAAAGDAFPRHVIKGGSYLSAPNYSLRYRPAARQGETIDTSAGDLGFRCVVRPA